MTDADPPTGLRNEDDDDHDLLTYGEVGARLTEEIADQEARVNALTEQFGDSEPTVVEAATRLRLLQEATERNANSPANLQRFEAAFGYKPNPDGA